MRMTEELSSYFRFAFVKSYVIISVYLQSKGVLDMSQAKVDQYKKEKANRQKIVKREKRMHYLEMTAIAVVCVAFFGWIGYSVYDKVTNSASDTQETVVFDAGAVQDYISGLAE
jgi:mannitol-specific phosphotransferase system IIBC component